MVNPAVVLVVSAVAFFGLRIQATERCTPEEGEFPMVTSGAL